MSDRWIRGTLDGLGVAHPRHPLVGRTNLQPQDLARFAAAMRAQGLWTQPLPMQKLQAG
jgi:hypothetical protein